MGLDVLCECPLSKKILQEQVLTGNCGCFLGKDVAQVLKAIMKIQLSNDKELLRINRKPHERFKCKELKTLLVLSYTSCSKADQADFTK